MNKSRNNGYQISNKEYLYLHSHPEFRRVKNETQISKRIQP